MYVYMNKMNEFIVSLTLFKILASK